LSKSRSTLIPEMEVLLAKVSPLDSAHSHELSYCLLQQIIDAV
jgi:hypothetical protein